MASYKNSASLHQIIFIYIKMYFLLGILKNLLRYDFCRWAFYHGQKKIIVRAS